MGDPVNIDEQLKKLSEAKGIKFYTKEQAIEEFGTKITPGATVSMKEEFGKITPILQKYGISTTYEGGSEKPLEKILKEYGEAVKLETKTEFEKVQKFQDNIKNASAKYGIPMEDFKDCKTNDDLVNVLVNAEKRETTKVIGSGFGVHPTGFIDGMSRLE
uniref:Uncharacterized protein n=1 Tax=Methanococcus maripaludis (strain C6 / ATCC BAA-1332) TaxID=444158 RepID=A9A7G4_METM6